MTELEVDMLYYVRNNYPGFYKTLGDEDLCTAYYNFRTFFDNNEPEAFVKWLSITGGFHENRNNLQARSTR